MGIFDRFMRRTDEEMARKNKVRNQPVHKIEEVKLEEVKEVGEVKPVEIVEEAPEVTEPKPEPVVEHEPLEEVVANPVPVVEPQVSSASFEDAFDQLDLAVAKLMGTYDGANAPKPYSTDKNLVMDMVTFARENKIKLPLFTSDPTRIATAIEKWGKHE